MYFGLRRNIDECCYGMSIGGDRDHRKFQLGTFPIQALHSPYVVLVPPRAVMILM